MQSLLQIAKFLSQQHNFWIILHFPRFLFKGAGCKNANPKLSNQAHCCSLLRGDVQYSLFEVQSRPDAGLNQILQDIIYAMPASLNHTCCNRTATAFRLQQLDI